MSRLYSLPRPAVFAHRGSSVYAPENTLAAFRLAVEQGADAIEFDAKLSADGQVVIIHDQTLQRTAGAPGKVGETSLAEMKKLDAGSSFSPDFSGEPIPTLSEVFDAVGSSIFMNVELTNYASPRDALPEKVCELIKRYGVEENVLFSSFNPLALNRAHRILPQVPLGLLALPGPSGLLARSFLGRWWVPYQALHPEAKNTTRSLVENVHRRGRRVHVWTVNDAETMQRLFDWDVDGIFTDDPILAMQVRDRQTAERNML